MNAQYESKIIGDHIAYWKFFKHATVEAFADAFEEFKEMVQRPQVTSLLVVAEMHTAVDNSIQHFWLETSEMASQYGITKWGIVIPTELILKKLAIQGLVRKGRSGHVAYDYLISDNEQEVLVWLKQ
jgi:hypothetical protein